MKIRSSNILISLLLLTSVGGITGCATKPLTQAQLDAGDYGLPPFRYEEDIKRMFSATLKDPYSAVYRFKSPYTGYLTKAPIAGGGVDKFGYMIEVWVNAKNSYGAYTGETRHVFFYKDGQYKDITYIANMRRF